MTIPVTQAQPFPARPILWLVPTPAASTTDIVMRIVAQKMSDAFGQQVIVDKKNLPVISAQAGIHAMVAMAMGLWILACAGTTAK